MGQTDGGQWMYRLCFWFSGKAMMFLDLWDGGYPPYQKEDWDERR
jgi:hypothetical protein